MRAETASGSSASNSPWSRMLTRAMDSLRPRRFLEMESDIEEDAPHVTPPMQAAGFFSRMYIIWATPLIMRAAKEENIGVEDLWPLQVQDTSQATQATLTALWNQEISTASRKNRDPAFKRAVWNFVRWDIYQAFCFKLVFFFCSTLSNSVLLQRVLQFLESPSEPFWVGVALAFAFLVSDMVRSVTASQNWLVAVFAGVRVRAGVRGMLYEKALRLRDASVNVGQTVNLLTNDAQRLTDAVSIGESLLSTPVGLAATLVVLWASLGAAALAGLAVLLLATLAQARLGRWVGAIRRRTILVTDERTRLMAEVLSGLRLIKYFGWELAFAERLAAIRAREASELHVAARARALNAALALAAPVLVTLATFASHTAWLGRELTPAQAFVTVAIFNVARFALSAVPVATKNVSEALIACRRIQDFLSAPEIDPADLPSPLPPAPPTPPPVAASPSAPPPAAGPVLFQARDACFTWYGPHPPGAAESGAAVRRESLSTQPGSFWAPFSPRCPDGPPAPAEMCAGGAGAAGGAAGAWAGLSGISFDVAAGEVLAVVGPVGAGKSALLLSALGQLRRGGGGGLRVRGRVAYAAQAPWIFSGSVRDNIVCGGAWDAARYRAAVAACALAPDLARFPGGDSAEIGERGLNLSGGQRARVALARAEYADADVCLFDDPLSAVDARVARHLWRHAVRGALAARGKAVVIVTHQAA